MSTVSKNQLRAIFIVVGVLALAAPALMIFQDTQSLKDAGAYIGIVGGIVAVFSGVAIKPSPQQRSDEDAETSVASKSQLTTAMIVAGVLAFAAGALVLFEGEDTGELIIIIGAMLAMVAIAIGIRNSRQCTEEDAGAKRE